MEQYLLFGQEIGVHGRRPLFRVVTVIGCGRKTGGRGVTFSVGRRVEPRLFLCRPGQSIPILVEKHFPL